MIGDRVGRRRGRLEREQLQLNFSISSVLNQLTQMIMTLLRITLVKSTVCVYINIYVGFCAVKLVSLRKNPRNNLIYHFLGVSKLKNFKDSWEIFYWKILILNGLFRKEQEDQAQRFVFLLFWKYIDMVSMVQTDFNSNLLFV